VSEFKLSESVGGSGQRPRPPSHWPHMGRPNHTTQAARALHATWMALHASWAGAIQTDSNHDEQPGPAGALPLPATEHVPRLAARPGVFKLVPGPGHRDRRVRRFSLRLSPSRRDLGCQPRARPPGGPARLGQLVLVAELARIECPNLKGCLFKFVDVHHPLQQPQAATARHSRLLPRSPDSAAASAGERGPSEGQSRRLAPRGLGRGSDERRGARPADWSGNGRASSQSDDGTDRREQARLPTDSRGRPRRFRTAVPAVRISACAAARAALYARHTTNGHGGSGSHLGMRWSQGGLRLLRRRHAPTACRPRLRGIAGCARRAPLARGRENAPRSSFSDMNHVVASCRAAITYRFNSPRKAHSERCRRILAALRPELQYSQSGQNEK
jgi:hypothetical protein